MWKDKKVLITGINGFIASHLAQELTNKRAKVYGIVLPGKESKYTPINCDLIDINQTVKTISDFKPDVIFHLAGQAISSMAKKEPIESFKSNVITTLNLLEASRIGYKTPIIYASTREVYDITNSLPYIEEHNLKSNTIYSCMKLIADNLVRVYFSSYNFPVAVVRASNTYGPNDLNFERIIPKIIKSIISNEYLQLFGNGSSSRDFVYVRDLVEGYISIAKNLLQGKYYGEVFNLSGEEPISIKEIVEKIIGISRKNPKIEFDLKSGAVPDLQYASSDKAKRLLQWFPRTNIDLGLKITYEWYLANKSLF